MKIAPHFDRKDWLVMAAGAVAVFSVLVLLIVQPAKPTLRNIIPSANSGLTPDEARQVQPATRDLTLTAERTGDGVLLKWTLTKDISAEYPAQNFDVYRRCGGSTGWGKRIGWLEVGSKEHRHYEFTDTTGGLLSTCDYQIVGVWVSGSHEVKQYVSNTVEMNF